MCLTGREWQNSDRWQFYVRQWLAALQYCAVKYGWLARQHLQSGAWRGCPRLDRQGARQWPGLDWRFLYHRQWAEPAQRRPAQRRWLSGHNLRSWLEWS